MKELDHSQGDDFLLILDCNIPEYSVRPLDETIRFTHNSLCKSIPGH